MADQTFNVNIDLNKIDNMKCYCGSELFNIVANLKWLSPIQIGNPNGGQAIMQKFQCANLDCNQIYEKVLPQDEVEKLNRGRKKPGGDDVAGKIPEDLRTMSRP